MAQYKQGLASTTAGSPVVTFTGTNLLTYATVGGLFCIDGDNTTYTIAAINSDTELVLTAPYPTTKTSVAFTITNDFTPNYNLPLIDSGDRNTAPLVKDSLTKIDAELKNTSDSTTTLQTNYTQDTFSNPVILDGNGQRVFDISTTDTVVKNQNQQTSVSIETGTIRYRINNAEVYEQTPYSLALMATNWRLYIGEVSGRMYIAPYNPSTLSYNWDREINYYHTPADGNPSWYIEQPPYKTPTPAAGCSLYSDWSKNAIWKDIEGYVNFSLMIRIPANTGSLTVATINQASLRPVGNNETFPCSVRLDNETNFIAGAVYIFTDGRIYAQFNGTTSSTASKAYVAVSGKFWRGI